MPKKKTLKVIDVPSWGVLLLANMGPAESIGPTPNWVRYIEWLKNLLPVRQATPSQIERCRYPVSLWVRQHVGCVNYLIPIREDLSPKVRAGLIECARDRLGDRAYPIPQLDPAYFRVPQAYRGERDAVKAALEALPDIGSAAVNLLPLMEELSLGDDTPPPKITKETKIEVEPGTDPSDLLAQVIAAKLKHGFARVKAKGGATPRCQITIVEAENFKNQEQNDA